MDGRGWTNCTQGCSLTTSREGCGAKEHGKEGLVCGGRRVGNEGKGKERKETGEIEMEPHFETASSMVLMKEKQQREAGEIQEPPNDHFRTTLIIKRLLVRDSPFLISSCSYFNNFLSVQVTCLLVLSFSLEASRRGFARGQFPSALPISSGNAQSASKTVHVFQPLVRVNSSPAVCSTRKI